MLHRISYQNLVVAALGLTILSSTAQAYTIRKTGNGAPLRWPAGKVAVEIALDDVPAGVLADEAEEAAVKAFDAYSGVMVGMATDVELQLAMKPSAATSEADDGKNVVRWVKSGWSDSYDPGALAVTLTSYDSQTGKIRDADIVVNALDYAWTASPGGGGCDRAYDLQNVLTHEIGHLFGLGHEKTDTDSTMYPSSGMCETKKRDLASDDLAGLAKLYVETAAPLLTDDGAAAMGCDVGHGNGPGGAVTATLIVGGILLGRRRPRLALVLGAFALALPRADATTVRPVTLDGMSGDAVVVVRGLVSDVSVREVEGRVFTDTTLAVAECLKGTCGALLTVRQLGGERDGVGMRVEGNAELDAGGEVVLLLRRRPDGAYAPLGMAQGAYHVKRSARGAIQALVHDVTGLRLAKPDGTQVTGTVETVTMDDVRAALARAARR